MRMTTRVIKNELADQGDESGVGKRMAVRTADPSTTTVERGVDMVEGYV